MNNYKQFRQEIESLEMPHPEFVSHLNALEQRITDALHGLSARLEWVVGPSRVGKTMLLKALARMHPATHSNGIHHQPVLVVSIPPGISPKLLPSSVLQALGVPIPSKSTNSGLMLERMFAQLRLAGTRVLIFDEASQLVDIGSKVLPRAAGDWFKSVMDTLNITILMFGVPRLEKLFESNEQLRLRACAKREFRPYNYQIQSEFMAFAQCVKTYADHFAKHGYPIGIALPSLVGNLYLLSGGVVGLIARFIEELASLQAQQPAHEISMTECALVANRMETACLPNFSPFQHSEVTAVEMTQARNYVLEVNDMRIPLVSPFQAEATCR